MPCDLNLPCDLPCDLDFARFPPLLIWSLGGFGKILSLTLVLHLPHAMHYGALNAHIPPCTNHECNPHVILYREWNPHIPACTHNLTPDGWMRGGGVARGPPGSLALEPLRGPLRPSLLLPALSLCTGGPRQIAIRCVCKGQPTFIVPCKTDSS